MIENYIKVLTSKNYQQQMKISIDNATETLKDVLREIESFRESPRTYALSSYLPSYQCAKKAEYTIGKAGIGPFALNNAHHVLTQLVQMRMATNAFTRTYDIDRLDKQYDNDGSGTRILDWLSALINAFVDIAKDPFVIRLNVNAYTYNITAYLIRMGYGRDTFYLLNQPIIVELAKNILNVRGNFGKPKDMTQYELEQSIIYETLRKYGVDYDHMKNRIKDFIYDNGEPNLEYEAQLATEKRRQFEGFRKVIRKEANAMEMRNAVQDAALLFFLFNKYASSVANLVKYSKIDTKKHGKSIAEWNAYLQGMEDLTTDEFFGEGEVARFYRSTFIEKKTYNTITWALSFNQVMLRASESFQNRLQNLLKVLGKKSKINPDVLNKIVNSMEAGIKAGFINEAFYATGRYDDLYDVFYGDYSVPRRLLKLKSDIKQGKYPDLLNDDGSIANEFLNYLFPNVYKNVTIYEQPDFVDTRMSTTLDINMQNEIIYSWDELLHYPNDEVRELAEDLIYYAFYTSGDQTNPNSFFRFVPFSWREGYVEEGENQFNAKGYASYIQNLLTNDGDINYSMLYDSDVFLNNWQDEVLVPTIPESVRTQMIVNGQLEYQTVGRIGVAATSVIEGTDLHPMILFMGDTNPKSEMYIKPVAYEIVGTRRIPIFSPYVKMQYTPKYNPNGILVYKLIGVNIRKTESGTYYTPIYSLVNKKGYNYKGHHIVEYGTSANFNFNTFLDATFQPISEDDLRSQRLMEYISRSIPNEKLQQYLLSFFSRAVPISQYYGMLGMQDFSSSKLFESYSQDDSADDSSSFVQSTKAPISAEDELDKRRQKAIEQFAESWSQKEGWSTIHFYTKVLPFINEAWSFEFQPIDNFAGKAQFDIQMNYQYGNEKRPGIKSNSTLEAIKNGERTSTTRYERHGNIPYLMQMKVGDSVRFYNKYTGEELYAVVTRPLYKLTDEIKSFESRTQNTSTDNPFDGVKSEWTYQDVLDLFGEGVDDDTVAIQEQIQALQQALEEMGYDDNEVSDLMNRFHQENDADIHTADDAANLIRKFICNL